MEENFLTAEALHEIFCNAMECEMLDIQYFKVSSYDEIDFINKLDKEKVNYDRDQLEHYSVIVKQSRNNRLRMYVNLTQLNETPYIVIESIFTHLFEIYKNQIPTYIDTYNTVYPFLKLKKIVSAFDVWTGFCADFMAINLLNNIFEDISTPYDNEDFIPSLEEILAGISKNVDTDKKDKISTIIYILANFAICEPSFTENITSLHKLKKVPIKDLHVIEQSDLGKLYNKLYRQLFISIKSPCGFSNLMSISKVIRKIEKKL